MAKEEELIKKGGNRAGRITQKMMSFRLDLDVAEWLDQEKNKGRVINDALRLWRKEKGWQ